MYSENVENAYEAARKNMLLGQLIPNRIHHHAMLNAIGSVPRERFVPDPLKGKAYADETLAFDSRRILFAPRIFANLLLLADIRKNDFILNLKSGIGYSAAVMSKLGLAVVGLESDAALCETAQQILIDSEIDNVAFFNQKIEDGFAKQAPFDVIFADGTLPVVPDHLLSQLSDDNGRLVCVVAKPTESVGRAVKVVKHNGMSSYTTAFEIDLTAFFKHPVCKNFIFEAVS